METVRNVAEVVKIGAALAVLIFFGVATYVVWPYRDVPAQTAALAKAYRDAAPRAGHLDQGIDALKSALPGQGKIDTLLSTATDTAKSLGSVGPAAVKAIGDTADELTRKCKGPEGPDACGTFSTVKKTVIKAGDAIVTTQAQERNVGPHVIDAMDEFKGSAQQLTATLKDPAVHDAAVNLGRAAGNLADAEQTGNGILLNVKKKTDQLVAPKTKTQTALEYMPAGLKLALILACITTGTACP